MVLVERDADGARLFEQIAARARTTCQAVCRTRDLSVGPGNVVTPTYLAEQAREVAQHHGLEILVWGKDELQANGMNGVLAVNQGSTQPPTFVAMRYQAPNAASAKTLAVVGKGITFDSGGISIKPADH